MEQSAPNEPKPHPSPHAFHVLPRVHSRFVRYKRQESGRKFKQMLQASYEYSCLKKAYLHIFCLVIDILVHFINHSLMRKKNKHDVRYEKIEKSFEIMKFEKWLICLTINDVPGPISSKVDTHRLWRRRFLGEMTMRGLRKSRWIWRRKQWK